MGDGTAADVALDKAKKEIITAFQPIIAIDRLPSLSQINIFDSSESSPEGNAYVLAMSSIFEQYATSKARINKTSTVDSELTYMLNNLADDLAPDGTITNATLIGDLIGARRLLRPDLIRDHLKNLSSTVGGNNYDAANIDVSPKNGQS